MSCAACIAGDPRGDLPIEQFLDELTSCEDCPGIVDASAHGKMLFERLRQSAWALRKSQSKLRQRERELHEAIEASARYEARIENMVRVYQQSTRELEPQLVVVAQQAETIRALSAPILEVGDGVVAMPIIGVFDEERGDLITRVLLARVHERPARLVILDLTGLSDVSANTGMALLRVSAALRLLGTKVALCGLGSRVAQALCQLDADLSVVRTFPSVRAALAKCR